MNKFFEGFRFEVILFVIGVFTVLIVAFVKRALHVEVATEFEIGLATAVALVPVALARLEAIMREDREATITRLTQGYRAAVTSLSESVEKQGDNIARMLRYCEDIADQEFLTRRRQLAVSNGFVSLLEKVHEHGTDCLPVIEQIEAMVRDVSEGKYPITNPDEVYRHDAQRIALLGKGDFYWATWSASANPYSLAANSPTSVAFDHYIKAQTDAAKRGVDVVRLYIVPNPERLPEHLQKHVKDLRRNGTRVYLVSDEKVRSADLCEDFVIIGRRVVGVGEPPRGPMERSVYYFNARNDVRAEYRTYKLFFEQLRSAALEVD